MRWMRSPWAGVAAVTVNSVASPLLIGLGSGLRSALAYAVVGLGAVTCTGFAAALVKRPTSTVADVEYAYERALKANVLVTVGTAIAVVTDVGTGKSYGVLVATVAGIAVWTQAIEAVNRLLFSDMAKSQVSGRE